MAGPISADEVAELVLRMYQCGNPQEINAIEKHLQVIQRSPQGWQLGDVLLQNSDSKIRFFGALTFTVKIKRDWETLNEEEASSLLERLLYHMVRLVDSGEGSLVVRKLCNALVAYYLQPSTSWQHCILHLMMCFAQGQVVPVQEFALKASFADVPSRLNESQLLASLWFAVSLAEEGKQTLVISTESTKQHKKVSSNVDDVVSLLQDTMRIPQSQETAIRRTQESLKCFQSWVMYAQRAWIDKALELGSLRSLMPLAIQALGEESLFEEATETLCDITDNFAAFPMKNDYKKLSEVLSDPAAQIMISELKDGDFNPPAMAFGRLLLAYGDANIQDLAQNEIPVLQQILNQLMDLMRCEGYAGSDDEICSQALEFWTNFVEFVTDSLFTTDPAQKPAWMQRAQYRVVEVIECCWEKIRQPPVEVMTTWGSDARSSFQSFRNDVQDILQISYTLLGLSIFEKFAWLALKALDDRAWLHLEATLFCINALSEAVADEEAVDGILSRLFGSSLFEDITNDTDSIPAKTRQIAVSMITKYIGFFERQVAYLPAMLTFLFHSVRAPAMANVAAKAIHTACSSCRRKLTGELDAFLRQYEDITSWTEVDFYVKEKVIGGIAAIIQALPSDNMKINPLSRLIRFVQQDVETCLKLMNQYEPEELQKYGVGALKCLVSIGKSLQTPDDVVIDLDDESSHSSTWSSGGGQKLQIEVVNITRKLTSLMNWNSDVMEAGCQILRAGFKETTPGLFVFPSAVTVDFVEATRLSSSRLELLIDTGSAMLSRQNHVPKEEIEMAAASLLNHGIKLIAALKYNPSAEPEVASSIIDLADKMVPRFLSSMIGNAEVPRLLEFTLGCLASPEILPKRSAAHFWATFVNKYDLPEAQANFMRAAMTEYGPRLCHILVHEIAGEAARSQLDTLAEPLKKLVFAQAMAKQWLAEALQSPDFPSLRIVEAQKRSWLQKVLSLRGARKTNNEVRDFWIACRGNESAFAF